MPRSEVYFMLARKNRQTDTRTETEKKSSMYCVYARERERTIALY